eukprot:4266327-Pyramimonas_sp.AAC.1
MVAADPGPRLAKNLEALDAFFQRVATAAHVWQAVPREVDQLFALGPSLLCLAGFEDKMMDL